MSRHALVTLTTKELYHLRPVIVAIVLLEALSLTEAFVSRSPDTMTWSDISVLLDLSLAGGAATIAFLLGMVTGYLLFPHEHDNGTLRFLWALPLARWQIFAVKVGSGLGLLVVLTTVSHIDSWIVYAMGDNSIAVTQFRWDYWWLELGLIVGIYAIALPYGVLVSWFRWIGILVFIIAWTATYYIGEFNPALTYLNPTALLDLEIQGDGVTIRRTSWLVHGAAAIGAVLLGGLLWTRYGERAMEPGKATARLVASALMLGGTLIALNYALSVIAPGFGDPTGADTGLAELRTRDYHLTYYREDTTRAQLLSLETDAYYDGVRSLLKSPPSDELIVADLTDSGEFHLGVAGWKRLRVARESLYDPHERAHVFVHETSHVLADLTANGRLTDHGAYTAFFNEGLAEWVSYETLDLPAQRHALRVLAAAAWDRHDLRFGDILFAEGFGARFDQNLIYALGEVWVSGLARACGSDAPGSVLRAIGRDDAPQRLRGQRFWQASLRHIGCDLTHVNTEMERILGDYAGEAGEIPEILTNVRRTGDTLFEVRLQLMDVPPEESFKVNVRLRDGPGTPEAATASRTVRVAGGDSPTITELRAPLSGERFQYQTGIYFIESERPFYSRWVDSR